MARRRKIDDREAPMAESEACFRVSPGSAIVRSAVRQTVDHSTDGPCVPSTLTENAGNAAHLIYLDCGDPA
jgi:hypothetical protein